MKPDLTPKLFSKLFLLFILALGLLVYWPGLSGGYVFDDFGNLVDNAAFAQSALQSHFWHAIWSAHAGPLDRPLSMFTFAAQMVFTGMNPWPLKLANVLLHLFNGALVWLLSARVLGWLERRAPSPWLVGAPALALLATAAWVLAPIQLTAVLYVIQREESLASAFVLLGLLAYWHGRMRLIAGRRGALAWIWGSLALGTALAALAKETGVMLPAYAFVLEWVVLRGARAATSLPTPALPTGGEGVSCSSSSSGEGREGHTQNRDTPSSPPLRSGGGREGHTQNRDTPSSPPLRSGGGREGESAAPPSGLNPLIPVFVVLLLIPGVLGLAWLLPGALNGSAYAARPFTLSERLFTEGRVLVDYLRWIVLPSPDALSLYHDDIALSTGWLSPWTTAASWAFLAALLGAALALRRRLPLFAFGVLWWFAGQSLLSTFVPLELVYEHRNYLPDWGVFLALFALLFTWSPQAAKRRAHLPHPVGEAGRGSPPDAGRRGTLRLLTVGAVLALITLYGLFTTLRAQTWGNPYRLAYFEATTHPKSPRASYDLGRMMLITAQGVDSPQFQMGMRQMEQGALLPGADLQPLQALVFMSAKNGLPIQPRWWAEMHHTIATQPMSSEDVGALYSLIQCSNNGVCHYTPEDVQQLGRLVAFAVQRNPGRADLVTLQANWAANLAHDNPLAYQLMLRAVALDPGKYDYWKNLLLMQMAAGLYADAGQVLERMRELNRFGIHDAEIEKLGHELQHKLDLAGRNTPPPNLPHGVGEEKPALRDTKAAPPNLPHAVGEESEAPSPQVGRAGVGRP
ncbi:tetratricopeptide repeat protein [Thiomonas intermedia]|uniref:tetratricopeptide repeat protein n=1 Tax=Thiomonas intermedia TaxID=926 RepID=UPI0009A51BDC|nr:hypothetical protein [Thiomonas intermedia]